MPEIPYAPQTPSSAPAQTKNPSPAHAQTPPPLRKPEWLKVSVRSGGELSTVQSVLNPVRPPYRLQGSELSEPDGMLQSKNCHLSYPRPHLHPELHLL
jgi:hypothetical protein